MICAVHEILLIEGECPKCMEQSNKKAPIN